MSKSYDYVLQQGYYDCGIASIITILKYFGINASRDEILLKFGKKNLDYTAYDLVKIAKFYGVNSYGIKTDIKNIEKLPVIAHVMTSRDLFHFIVIFEINEKKQILKVMDPAFGIKEISFSSFYDITTEIFLIFEGKKKKLNIDLRFKKELIKIFQSNKRVILFSFFLSLIYSIISLFFSYYLRLIFTYADYNSLFYILLVFIVTSFFKNFISFIKNKLIYGLNIKIDRDIISRVITHIFNLPYKYFVSKSTGELVEIVSDIENFKDIVVKIFVTCLVDIFFIIIIIFYLLFVNYIILFIFLFIIFVFLFIAFKYKSFFNIYYNNLKSNNISFRSFLIDSFNSFESIKNLNISNKIKNVILDKQSDVLNINLKYNSFFNKYNFINFLLTDLLYLFVIFISCYLFNDIKFEIVFISSLFYIFIGLLGNISETIHSYEIYKSSTSRVLDCLEVKEESFSSTNLCNINSICFKNVSFLSLSNINLSLYKGDRVYITGASGIGKSTLMKFLLRYYDDYDGDILIDDINIKYIDLSFLREYITYVSQNESLFSGTVSFNLELVNSYDYLSVLSLVGFDKNKSLIVEGGNNLSGGERKKLVLARGLLKFKSVLILDEVFNEISVFEERQILSNIFSLYKDKIIIVISHRESNCDLFNKKYVLEEMI